MLAEVTHLHLCSTEWKTLLIVLPLNVLLKLKYLKTYKKDFYNRAHSKEPERVP